VQAFGRGAELKVLFTTKMPVIGALLLALSACTSAPRFPVLVDSVSASQPPVVGRIIEFSFELHAIKDEPELVVSLIVPDQIHVFGDEPVWSISLSKGESASFSTHLCVLQEGQWRMDIGMTSRRQGEFQYSGVEVIGIISGKNDAEILREQEITYSQREQEPMPTPDPTRLDPDDC
jgi:hypothetical protein